MVGRLRWPFSPVESASEKKRISVLGKCHTSLLRYQIMTPRPAPSSNFHVLLNLLHLTEHSILTTCASLPVRMEILTGLIMSLCAVCTTLLNMTRAVETRPADGYSPKDLRR